MATSQLTPLTPLLARMRSLPASRAQRLRLADELAADTTPLVMDMLASVQVLDGFDGGEEAFTGERPDIVCDLGEVAHRERGLRTADFAFWLAARGHLAVMLEPQLDCRYVDRELVPTRAQRRVGRADAPRSATLRLDLLMVNVAGRDGTPVVAEVKIGRDKDPFAGLVQAVAGLVHLATPAQYRRLRAAYPHAGFPEREQPPPLDAYVLCVDPMWDVPLMGELLLAAREIARNLSQARETSAIMRRAALLELTRAPGRLWIDAARL